MKKLCFAVVLLALTACVTINIYFPAAAAEKAADTIIKSIQDVTEAVNKESEPEAKVSDWQLSFYTSIDSLINVIISPAEAANKANLSIDSTEIKRLRYGMKARFKTLKPFYNKGYIGIQTSGYLSIRNSNEIPLRNRNKIKKLIAVENTDRKALYQAIANANGHPEWFAQIKTTFAKRWIMNARSGWWYQKSNNSWIQK